MKDMALTSDLYNNIKFNMQKLILDVEERDSGRLAGIFGENEEEIKNLITEFESDLLSESEYARENFKVPEYKGAKPLAIAFVGDSITSDRASYLNILRTIYKDNKNIRFIDAAVSGDKSDDAVMKLFLRVMNHKPDLVHILLGTNDLRRNENEYSKPCINIEEIKANLIHIIKTVKASGSNVIISTISPIDNERLRLRFPDDNWYYEQNDIDSLNEAICEMAAEYDVELNDMRPIYAQFDKDDILLSDGLHLNQKGQRLLLENVLISLGKYL